MHVRPLIPVLVAVLALPSSPQSVVYEVHKLQLPPSVQPGAFTDVLGINRFGATVSNTFTAFPDDCVAVLDDGSASRTLPPLPGASYSVAVRILASNIVIGYSGTGPFSVPCMWDRQGNVHPLRILPGFVSGFAGGGNSKGDVVGYCTDAFGFDVPVMWHHGVLTRLPLPAGFVSGRVTAINDNGWIAGIAFDGFGVLSGLVIDPSGQPTAISATPFESSALSGINQAAQAVGASIDFMTGSTSPIYFQAGQIHLVPEPPEVQQTILFQVNRSGTSVGLGFDPNQGIPKAVVSDGSAVMDLTPLLDPVTSSGLMLIQATAINSRGQIGASAFDTTSGGVLGCVLTPIHTSSVTASDRPALPSTRARELRELGRRTVRSVLGRTR